MSRLISDSYMYQAIGAEMSGACGKCSLPRSVCMGQSLSRMDVCGIIDDAPTIDAIPIDYIMQRADALKDTDEYGARVLYGLVMNWNGKEQNDED